MGANVKVLAILTEKRRLDPHTVAGVAQQLNENTPPLRRIRRWQSREFGDERAGAMCLRKERPLARVVSDHGWNCSPFKY
jgi:hypothetical protein